MSNPSKSFLVTVETRLLVLLLMVTVYNKIWFTVVKPSQGTSLQTKTIPLIRLPKSCFKDRLYSHKHSSKYESQQIVMELRNFIWNLKKKNIEVPLQWSILDKTKPYLSGSRNCRLCLIEKYHILFMGSNLLKERNKLVLKCRHERKYYLSNYKGFSP